jgi:hypothetical protein
MAKVNEAVAHAEIVGGGQTGMHSHAGGGAGLPDNLHGLQFGLLKGATQDRRYPAGGIDATAITTGASVSNVLRVLPFIPPEDMTADKISCYVSTLQVGKIRLGAWANGTNLYPGARLADSGELDTGSAGIKDATISVVMIKGILYWIGYCSNAATPPTFRALAVGSLIPILGLLNNATPTWGVGWTVAFTYAALPDPYPVSATILAGGTMPIVAVRAA